MVDPAATPVDQIAEARLAELLEQARAQRQEIRQRVAALRQRRAAALAGQPPDPNRPPPDWTPLKLGPGIIPASPDDQ